jgi:ABC-2 type transport system ATP-binding protein
MANLETGDTPAISIENLVKTYTGKRRTRVEALRGISLSVEQGEVFGFLGPNGAGKSTTIKCLVGLMRATSGTARIKGVPIGEVESRRHLGYLPENPAFYDYLTGAEYLNFVGKSFGMAGDRLASRCEEVLQRLELWDSRKRQIRSYSKGMVQRVGIAQALLHDPEIYILDEPMSGLDPLGRALVKEIILELKSRGKCVFFSTHITADVESVCDRLGIILKGELKSVERVDSIMSQGITGYHLSVRVAGQKGSSERYVSREELPGALREIEAQGGEVTLVEPERKSLEDFFLKIVRGEGADSFARG